MTRKVLVTVGISLILDYVPEREGLGLGFESLPRPIQRLERLAKELKVADRRHAAAEPQRFNPNERQWVETRAALVAALRNVWSSNALTDREKRKYSGAELASLQCLGKQNAVGFAPLAADDELLLLASDTAPGIFCAELIADVLRGGQVGLPVVIPTIKVITRLRPQNAELFLAAGLPNAAQAIYQARLPGREMLLIGSGGYKGLLPYLVPVAMQLQVPVLYLYEESEELMVLLPLPLTLDLGVIEHNPRAFNQLWPAENPEERQSCKADDFWASVNAQHQRVLRDLKLVEEFLAVDVQAVRLSPTGVLARLMAYDGREPTALPDNTPLLGRLSHAR